MFQNCEKLNKIDVSKFETNELNDINLDNKKIYVTNQTTLSIYEINNIYSKIKNKYPNSIIDDKICMATTERQKAVYESPDVDLCIVIGDLRSSNTKKLAEVAKKED